ncbi:MAG: ATP12 family chaperone protein [Hyphomicrobium sp.]
MTSKAGNDNGDEGARPASGAPRGPIADSMAKPRAKRFYKNAAIDKNDGFRVLLDGRTVRTPAKRALALPTEALAAGVAAEWAAQGEWIDPATMPFTRFANTAIDSVADALDAVAADIAAYASSDLLCYRAEAPVELIAAQSARWNPVLEWAGHALGAQFRVAAGVKHVAQPPGAIERVAEALGPHDAFRLTAVHVLTTLTGSALLALAHARGRLTPDEAWLAAHVDEDYQIGLWGEDYEAALRRKARRAEFEAACRFLAARDAV